MNSDFSYVRFLFEQKQFENEVKTNLILQLNNYEFFIYVYLYNCNFPREITLPLSSRNMCWCLMVESKTWIVGLFTQIIFVDCGKSLCRTNHIFGWADNKNLEASYSQRIISPIYLFAMNYDINSINWMCVVMIARAIFSLKV